MENQENLTNIQTNDHHDDLVEEVTSSVTRVIDGDTYPISDNESTTDSVYIIDTNTVQLQKNDDEQGEFNQRMFQDSLANGEQNDNKNNKNERPSSTTTTNSKMTSKISTIKSTTNGVRSLLLDEHIKLVKQKKEEAEVLRLQKFQEQLRKKEQKWQQQQVERVKKWLQLRNRDSDHRSQVEERRKKREEEAKAKIDEILRREKEREQNYQQRVNHNLKINVPHKPDSVMSMSTDIISTRRAISASRLRSNHQDMTNQQASNDSPDDNSTIVISSHQLNPIDEQPHHDDQSNDESLLSGTHHSSARSQTRPMTTSYAYWLHTGDNNNNNNNNNSANFMRSTYAAKCRSHYSYSVERCPRASRARDEINNNESQHRILNTNRQHLNETIHRLSKPKTLAMTQSVHISATSSSSSNNLPISRSSHQLRLTNSAVSSISSNNRRHIHTRPATVPTSNNESRTSPTDESSNKQSIHRPTIHSKVTSSSTKPPMTSSFSRSKPSTQQRSLMTTSNSSSSISSSAIPITNKRRIVVTSPTRSSKTATTTTTTTTITNENQSIINNNNNNEEEENLPVNEELIINDEKLNSKQQLIDEQEYQRKLNQKIREAQQRLEIERQREEERKHQLELEEQEREQEQIRLVEEQHRIEQERLQRAIEERQRENELKRQEEQRLQQQREEFERKQAEETERLNRERQERVQKEEQERNERKKRLDLIMRRTRPISPTSKQENNSNKITNEQTNGYNQTNNISSPTSMIKSSIPHSMSDTRFPTSSSNEHFLINNDSIISSTTSSTTDIPKFKSPLIQSLLNKARNTRSTDNLSQTSMTSSQIMTESMIDESITPAESTTLIDLSDDDHQENSTTNGHTDIHLSSSTNLNSYHDRPMETATAFQ